MKKAISLLLATVMILTLMLPAAFAADTTAPEDPVVTADGEGTISPLSEQTEVFTMYIGGVLHYRVWSLTEGHWLTPWLPVM